MQHHACYYEGCKQERPPDLPTYSVEALTVEHVQAAVRFANEHNIAVSIKTSGHNYAGSSTARGSLLIWLKNLRRFGEFGPLTDSCGTTHPLTQHLGGGEAWGDAYKAAVNNGYTVIGGGGANVGCCGGWLAGSGLSWTTRNNGFGLDNVLQYEVVTADGERKIVDACSEPDLYWALRGGGGGSFGVVTSLYYRAFPTIPVVMVRGTPRVLESSTVRHTGPCLRPPHTPHPCCVHAQMRLSHNGLSSSSLLGSWCWEKVQAGGTLNASNLPNRSACFPGAEDWVGVIDSWQASPHPAPSPAHPAHATPRTLDRALASRTARSWARLIACGTRAAQDHPAATGRRGGHPQPPSQVGWLLERPHPCRGGRGPDRWPATLLPRQRAGDARHRRPSRKAAGVA